MIIKNYKLFLLILMFCILLVIYIYYKDKLFLGVERLNSDLKKNQPHNLYQGPVRLTDDEIYFRKTGITKPLESN